MRKWLSIASAAWLAALLVAVVSPADQPPTTRPAASQQGSTRTASAPADPPGLVIDEALHDFGEVWAGEPLEYSFKLTNAGKGTLEIIRVQPTCGCTVAGAYPKHLLPGQSGSLPFRLDTQKLRGKFQKTINLTTNDPTQPNARLTLAGDCKRMVEVTPADAVFGRITESKHQERMLTIRSRGKDPLIASLVTPMPNSNFQYMLLESVPGREYRLFVSIDPPFKTGSLNESVTITTNVEKNPTLIVHARAIIPARVDVMPASLVLPLPKPGPASSQPATRQLHLTNSGDKPLKLLSASVDDPALALSTSEIKAGKQYQIDLRIPPGYHPPETGRTVLLKTDDPEFAEIKVNLRSAAAPAAAQNTPNSPTSKPTRPALALLGQTAPPFALKTIDGLAVGTNEYKSSPATVLDFVAPNCGYCKKQLPNVEIVRSSFESRGVRFVNVMETMRQDFTQDQIVEVLKTVGSKSQVAIDPGNAVGRQFKATSYPTLFVVDKDGKIVEVMVGAKSNIAEVLTDRLNSLLGAAPSPQASRPAGS